MPQLGRYVLQRHLGSGAYGAVCVLVTHSLVATWRSKFRTFRCCFKLTSLIASPARFRRWRC